MVVSTIIGGSVGSPGVPVQPQTPNREPKHQYDTVMDTGKGRPAHQAGSAPQEESVARALREEPRVPPRVTDRAATRIHVDEATERFVAEILDQDFEVIRQIPPEEQLQVIAKAREYAGVIFDQLA